jgi:predicted nucleic acid-binding protein
MIHLDTSFLIHALVSGSPEASELRNLFTKREALAMSCLCWTEFLCGPLKSHEVELATKLVQELVPFAAEDSIQAADLYNLSGRRRGTLIDCMIAATAIRCDAILATANPADFRKFQTAGLKLLL